MEFSSQSIPATSALTSIRRHYSSNWYQWWDTISFTDTNDKALFLPLIIDAIFSIPLTNDAGASFITTDHQPWIFVHPIYQKPLAIFCSHWPWLDFVFLFTGLIIISAGYWQQGILCSHWPLTAGEFVTHIGYSMALYGLNNSRLVLCIKILRTPALSAAHSCQKICGCVFIYYWHFVCE